MISRPTISVIAIIVGTILIATLCGVTLWKKIAKSNAANLNSAESNETTQDLLDAIQTVTAIMGVLLAIVPIIIELYDRHSQRNSRLTDNAVQHLLRSRYRYMGGLVECAISHIKHLCKLQLQRYRAFSVNQTAATHVHHVASDLVQLKYSDNVFGGEASKWTVDGGPFNIQRVMTMITETHDKPLNLLIEAHAGCGKTHLLHHIASCWMKEKTQKYSWKQNHGLLHTVDLLFLIRCEDLVYNNLTQEINDIIGIQKNEDEYNKWQDDDKKRIVILLDGYDEIAGDSTNDNENLKRFVEHRSKNIVLVVSTRRHKMDAIAGGDNHINWTVVRCIGINENSISSFVHTRICGCNETDVCDTNKNNVEQICTALKKNELHQNALFILIVCKLFTTQDLDLDGTLNMYSLMRQFCAKQLNRLKSINPEELYKELGWFAIKSDAVESVKTFDQEDLHACLHYSEDNMTLIYRDPKTNVEKTVIANIKKMQSEGCSAGLLYRNSTDVVHQITTNKFMHKTIAEFAVARLLYNAKLWKYVDTLDNEKWSMVHYYLLMHSIYTDDKDDKIWQHQLTYSFNVEYTSTSTKDLWYVIHWASKNGYYKIIDKLLNYDHHVGTPNTETSVGMLKTGIYKYTPLMIAANFGRVECIRSMLNDSNIRKSISELSEEDINKQNHFGITTLMMAAHEGHDKCVQLLIDNGVDVNKQNNKGHTALMEAAWCGHDKCVQLLIANGADVNKQKNNGHTALILASLKGHSKCVQLLINNGADVNKQEEGGNTAIMLATQEGHAKCVQLLKEALERKEQMATESTKAIKQ